MAEKPSFLLEHDMVKLHGQLVCKVCGCSIGYLKSHPFTRCQVIKDPPAGDPHPEDSRLAALIRKIVREEIHEWGRTHRPVWGWQRY